jgi:diacylglycerol O-acyltransferase
VDQGRRLSAADAAWLGLDRPEHLMVVTAVLRLDRRIELEPLRGLVRTRLLSAYPTLRMRPVRSRLPLVRPRWHSDPGFDLTQHVRSLELPGTRDEPALMQYVGELMSHPLDPARPPWALTLVQLSDHSAVVARLHHCLADGIALAGVLLTLVDDANADRPRAALAAPTTRPATGPPGNRPQLRTVLSSAVRTVSKVMVGRGDGTSRLRGPASVGRDAAWTGPQDLDRVKAAAAASGTSVNDVLLAAVAGGLRRWLLAAGARPADLRVMVPVDLRRGEPVPAELGNRFGIVFVALPVATPSAAERLAAVHTATTEAKRSPVAPASYALLSLVGRLPRWGQGLAATLLGRIATVIVTNVPGPREPLSLAGGRLRSVVFWVPHIGPIGVGVSIFSYAGTVTLGVATNGSLRIPAIDLVAAIEAELTELTELTDLGPRTAPGTA